MSEDLRRVFDAALPEEEPPLTSQASDLAATGRRRRHRRRVGYAVSGATFAVSAITAAALVLPGLAGGLPAGTEPGPGGRDESTQEPPPAADLPKLSKQVRSAMYGAFHDVEFTKASGWDVGEEPFELTEEGSGNMPYLVGYANVKGEGLEVVGVELYPPGEFSTEFGTSVGGDRDTDEFLIDCGTKKKSETTIKTTCDAKELDDGSLLRTVKAVEKSNATGQVEGREYTAVAYRADDTAVVLRTECHGSGESTCDKDEFDTVKADAIEQFVVFAPKIPPKP